MLKTTRNMFRLTRAITVGMSVGWLKRAVASRFKEQLNDPLYYHWYSGLNELLIASRNEFDAATKEILFVLRGNDMKIEKSM